MDAIRLDYVSNNRPSGWGIVIVGVAILIALATWQYVSILTNQSLAIERAVFKAREATGTNSTEKKVSTKISSEMEEKIQNAGQLANFLLIPWNDVFNALETASLEDTALLSIEPDPKKNQLTIIAEAKNSDVMFSYMQRLENTKELSDVYMLKHEIMEDAPMHPLRFLLTAQWVEKR